MITLLHNLYLYYFNPKKYCKINKHTPGYIEMAGHDEPFCYVCNKSILDIEDTDPWRIRWLIEFERKRNL